MERAGMNADIIIVGASARAPAFSTLRAGLRPACVDLFADADLCAACPAEKIGVDRYPSGLAEFSDRYPAGPWLFTGGLENHPEVIRAISQNRALWGCSRECLALVRAPDAIHQMLIASDLRSPRVVNSGNSIPNEGCWLLKPIASAAGFGIRHASAEAGNFVSPGHYGQEFVEGMSCSGLFIGHEFGCVFLGATIQLTGTEWLHAAPFHYAGSVGPISLPEVVDHTLRKLGNLLAGQMKVRGLFGVDFILKHDEVWVIEVNPRYTASVEVWEYAQQQSAMALNRRVFERNNHAELATVTPPAPADKFVGKAIYFAKEAITIPELVPWATQKLVDPFSFEMPAFADLPRAGDRIGKGHPVITLLEFGASTAGCLEGLKARARSLDFWLHGP
jgi:uncharacterized protein